MRLLAIETATDHLGVAVVDETRLLASYELLAERPHAIELPQAVTRVVQASRCGLGDIDAVAVDIGPGSFTGLRIGLAFVKALVFRMQRPVVGVSSLDVLAAQLAFSSVAVCPLLDAKQRKVYAALYQAKDGTAQKQSDYLLTTIDELITLLKPPVVFVGDGVALYREALAKRLGARAHFASPELWAPRAATLGRLGLARLAQGLHDDPSTLVPMYLYPHDCSVRLPDQPSRSPAPTAQPA